MRNRSPEEDVAQPPVPARIPVNTLQVVVGILLGGSMLQVCPPRAAGGARATPKEARATRPVRATPASRSARNLVVVANARFIRLSPGVPRNRRGSVTDQTLGVAASSAACPSRGRIADIQLFRRSRAAKVPVRWRKRAPRSRRRMCPWASASDAASVDIFSSTPGAQQFVWSGRRAGRPRQWHHISCSLACPALYCAGVPPV